MLDKLFDMGTTNITRHGITPGTNGLPIISRVVTHYETVYLHGVTADPAGDMTTQTRQVLERIDELLRVAGSHKSKLLSAQVWLSDMKLFAEHNAVWNDWVDKNNPPVRACVGVEMSLPNMLVEIMVTASK